jgi:hypothetical protein
MNDDEMLATMRRSLTGLAESLTDVRMERPVATIQSRARGRRLRHGVIGAGTGGLALGVGLALAASGGPAASGDSAARARPVHVNLDAWSVNTLSNGKVYVDVRELQNPALLRQTLADAGIPAIVTFGEFCAGPSGSANQYLREVLGKASVGGQARLTIDPAGIPHGSELSIGIMTVTKRGVPGLDASFGLVKIGAHLTCGELAPSPTPSGARQGQGNPTGNSTAKTGFGS